MTAGKYQSEEYGQKKRTNTYLVSIPPTQELNTSAQRCLTRFITGDFAS
jgi:hypothetical protein